MMVAPVMLCISLVMARYLLWRDEIVSGTHQDGIVWRAAMGALWPIRLLVRGLLALFWIVNDLAEHAAECGGPGGPVSALAPRSVHRSAERVDLAGAWVWR